MSDNQTDNDHDNTLVIPEQSAIHVYTNPEDAVVIWQGASGVQDEEHFVYVHRWHLPALIEKLQTFLPTTKGRSKQPPVAKG